VFSLKLQHLPKHVGEAHLMFVLIKNEHLVGTVSDVRWYCWQFYRHSPTYDISELRNFKKIKKIRARNISLPE
jgi:hypothetical protein